MKTIYAIPGLGTTEKIFSLLKFKNCELKVLNWPKPLPGMNMKEYAQLFMEQIDSGSEFHLLGMSFGGMLCSELTEFVKYEKLILISSCKNKSEFPILLKLLKYLPVHRLFSESFLRKMALHYGWLLGFKKDFKKEFKEMLDSMPENYLRNSTDMILNWVKTNTSNNCIHIHGDSDKLLRFKNVRADYVIHNGTHAMIVYQADEISEILNKLLD